MPTVKTNKAFINGIKGVAERPMKAKTKPQRVTWMTEPELECAIMGALGIGNRGITKRTGLTDCQVNYRLRKAGIKRADYRNGESEMAELVLRRQIPSRISEVRSILHLEAKK